MGHLSLDGDISMIGFEGLHYIRLLDARRFERLSPEVRLCSFSQPYSPVSIS